MLKKIGQGNFGNVFLAQSELDRKYYVIKVRVAPDAGHPQREDAGAEGEHPAGSQGDEVPAPPIRHHLPLELPRQEQEHLHRHGVRRKRRPRNTHRQPAQDRSPLRVGPDPRVVHTDLLRPQVHPRQQNRAQGPQVPEHLPHRQKRVQDWRFRHFQNYGGDLRSGQNQDRHALLHGP